jgi:hypothetical protein
MTGLRQSATLHEHLTLRSGRRPRLEGWEPVLLLPCFETPRSARLPSMRLYS